VSPDSAEALAKRAVAEAAAAATAVMSTAAPANRTFKEEKMDHICVSAEEVADQLRRVSEAQQAPSSGAPPTAQAEGGADRSADLGSGVSSAACSILASSSNKPAQPYSCAFCYVPGCWGAVIGRAAAVPAATSAEGSEKNGRTNGPYDGVDSSDSICPDASAPPLLRCGRCRQTFYCSAKCQRAHWRQHRASCRCFDM
jgi:hypothetical protein